MKSQPAVKDSKVGIRGPASRTALQLGKDRRAGTRRTPLQLTVEDDAGESPRTVLFDQTPEVLFRQQSERVTWLYFHNHKLVAAVQTDAIPDARASYETCRTNWPAKVRANEYGVISEAYLNTGTVLQGKFTFAIALSDPALYGTPRFWFPLEDGLEVSRDDMNSIKEIAERESPPPAPMDTSLVRYFKRSSGVCGGPNLDDRLIDAFKLHMDKLPKGTAKIEVMKEIAKEECSRARNAPRECIWLRNGLAMEVHRLHVANKTPDRALVARIAAALERRLNRALAKSRRPHPANTPGHFPDIH